MAAATAPASVSSHPSASLPCQRAHQSRGVVIHGQVDAQETPSQEGAPAPAAPVLGNSSLYVGDLDREVSEAQLFELFSQVGGFTVVQVALWGVGCMVRAGCSAMHRSCQPGCSGVQPCWKRDAWRRQSSLVAVQQCCISSSASGKRT